MIRFEIHLTVEPTPEAASLCVDMGLEYLCVELSTGRHPSQTMVTTEYDGALDGALRHAADVAAAFKGRGQRILRTKLECRFGVDGPQAVYLEHHLLLNLDGEEAERRAGEVCSRGGAHLSRTARVDSDGRERFATLRDTGVAADEQGSLGRAEAFRRSLESSGVHVVKTISERCVFDSNLALDEGWM